MAGNACEAPSISHAVAKPDPSSHPTTTWATVWYSSNVLRLAYELDLGPCSVLSLGWWFQASKFYVL